MISEYTFNPDLSPETNEALRKLYEKALPFDKSAEPAQGDILYYDGTNFTKLAAGTSGYFLKTQGTSANPIWAAVTGNMAYSDTRFKVGSFTRDTTLDSGTQEVTGVGFQPKAIIFFAYQDSADEGSWGFDDGTTAGEMTKLDWSGAGLLSGAAYSIEDQDSSGNSYYGKINSFDTDGFTIVWEKNGSPSGTLVIRYLAFR